ncbi:MAG: FKBP-type peptidyl-prolyl cis-trans isomerase [Lachnospiraceae bacterium]|nr:FKBP-type peptidyl-prolyl cis-trans isomerase [Lachnospiraceae bacterium]
MKKTIILFLTLLTLAGLAACGNKSGNATPTEGPEPTLALPTNTYTPTPTNTPSPTPTPTPIPIIVTDASTNTTVFLSDYKGYKFLPLTEEMLDEAVRKALEDYADEVEVDRAAKNGDIVLITYVGYIDGEPIEGGSYEEGLGLEVVLGSGELVDTFEDQIIGHTKDETFDVNINYPEDYGNEDLKGKTAVFKVTLNVVMEYSYPELSDELAKSLLGFDSAEAYRESIREKEAKDYENAQILDNIFANFRIENLHQDDITAYADKMFNYYYKRAAIYAAFLQTDINEVLSFYYGVPSLDDLRLICDSTAETNLRVIHCCKAIFINEEMQLSDEIINEWTEKNYNDYGYASAKDLIDNYPPEDLKNDIIVDSVYDLIYEYSVR